MLYRTQYTTYPFNYMSFFWICQILPEAPISRLSCTTWMLRRWLQTKESCSVAPSAGEQEPLYRWRTDVRSYRDRLACWIFLKRCVYIWSVLCCFFSLLKMNLFKTGCDTFTVSGNRGNCRKWCLMGDVGILTYETDVGETWWIMVYVGPCKLGIMGNVGRDRLKKKVRWRKKSLKQKH